ncbi:hypothetical protein [Desulfuribacillus alkaliarsenatis]|uniref:Uncharacterized protein n=1 Tax=Desulfuribacillus alkaliarsenatis TaxID=766136 RepID=A0A1E5FZV9_9FIRM|nr:hypothetical protein [Desulfuribacillus alkaliarsenatis]OEF96117.1 hypothetical protein BHF68_10320 [Desulfuribacillus alkaliarsenatis]
MEADANNTEEKPSNDNINYKKKFRICLAIILVLSFLLYGQWTSRTDMYISSRTSLTVYLHQYKFHIEKYLNEGDQYHLHVADSYTLPITAGAALCNFYYQDRLGFELRRNFNTIFDRFSFNVFDATTEELNQRVEDVERILEAIYHEPMRVRYSTNNSLIPINPYTKKRAKALLEVTDEIINNRIEDKVLIR